MSPTGRTAGAGWQAGARRTFPVAEQAAWELLVSPQGQELWLGGTIDLAGRRRVRAAPTAPAASCARRPTATCG